MKEQFSAKEKKLFSFVRIIALEIPLKVLTTGKKETGKKRLPLQAIRNYHQRNIILHPFLNVIGANIAPAMFEITDLSMFCFSIRGHMSPRS